MYQKNLKVFRLKASILGLKFVNLVMFNCSLLSKTCLNVYRPTSLILSLPGTSCKLLSSSAPAVHMLHLNCFCPLWTCLMWSSNALGLTIMKHPDMCPYASILTKQFATIFTFIIFTTFMNCFDLFFQSFVSCEQRGRKLI